MRPGPGTSSPRWCRSSSGSGRRAPRHAHHPRQPGPLDRGGGGCGRGPGPVRRAGPIFERVLGAEHPDTLTTRGNLARWTGRGGGCGRGPGPVRRAGAGPRAGPRRRAPRHARPPAPTWPTGPGWRRTLVIRGEESKPESGPGKGPDVRVSTQPRSPDGALSWPDGCGIYQRRALPVLYAQCAGCAGAVYAWAGDGRVPGWLRVARLAGGGSVTACGGAVAGVRESYLRVAPVSGGPVVRGGG